MLTGGLPRGLLPPNRSCRAAVEGSVLARGSFSHPFPLQEGYHYRRLARPFLTVNPESEVGREVILIRTSFTKMFLLGRQLPDSHKVKVCPPLSWWIRVVERGTTFFTGHSGAKLTPLPKHTHTQILSSPLQRPLGGFDVLLRPFTPPLSTALRSSPSP